MTRAKAKRRKREQSICQPELVSGSKLTIANTRNKVQLIPNGDLQIMPATYKIWYKKLGLTGGKTRYNYLIVGIAYLKYCKDQGDGTWRQARYIYARGRWKNPSQWTKLEHRFMSDIDWKLYD